MKIVHKFELPLTAQFHEIFLLEEAKILVFGDQDGSLYVWIETVRLVSPTMGRRRKFCVVGTGQSIPSVWEHRGSCQSGSLVWHLYEVH